MRKSIAKSTVVGIALGAVALAASAFAGSYPPGPPPDTPPAATAETACTRDCIARAMCLPRGEKESPPGYRKPLNLLRTERAADCAALCRSICAWLAAGRFENASRKTGSMAKARQAFPAIVWQR